MVVSSHKKKTKLKSKNRPQTLEKVCKWRRARDSIIGNWPFWTTCIVCLSTIAYSQSVSYMNVILTFIASMYIGYDLHRKTHERNISVLYDNLDNQTLKYIKAYMPALESGLKWFMEHCDFHDKIHHNTEINKEPYNVFVEVYQNLLSEGLIAAALCYWLRPSLNIGKITISPHIPTIIFWSLLYTSVHNINYEIIRPQEHINHHLSPDTNFGIDLMDILHDTKYEPEGYEIMHHAVPNIIIITVLILWFQKRDS